MPYRLGKYLLLERINQGGMAFVYLAKTFGWGGADQVLALKCIRPEIEADPTVGMFIDEAKLAVQLSHANIAKTYELGCIDSTYFIAMEHVLGRDLRAVIDRAKGSGGGIPEGLALLIVAHVLDGLDYAHRKTDLTGVPLHIVHRDVSPQNVLLSYAGEVKLIDFGIAIAASHSAQSQAGVLRGKYGYMSPEQVRALPIDARSDLFSTGVLLFELLTLTRLFPGSSDFSILEKVRYAEVYPPSLAVPGLPEDIEAIVLKALAREPADRFATASDMRDAVVQAMLRHYGHPTPRDLAAWMLLLFDTEQRADLGLLDRAAQLTQMPTNAVIYSAADELEEATPLPAAEDDDEAGETTVISAFPARPGTAVIAAASVASGAPSNGVGRPTTVDATPPNGSAPMADDAPAHRATEPNTALTRVPAAALGVETDERDGDTAVVPALRRPAPVSRPAAEDDEDNTDRVRRAALRVTTDPGERTDRIKLSTLTEDTDVSRRVAAAPAAGKARSTQETVHTSVVSAHPRRGLLRDGLIVALSFLVGGSIVAGSWYATRRTGIAYGGVVVNSTPPGAEVLIDGARVGVTPFSSTRVLAGKHSVVVRKAGNSEARETVVVEANEVTTIEMQLGRPSH